MRRRVRELIRPRNVACGKNVGVERLQVFVGFHRARFTGGNTQLLQAVASGIGNAPNRAEQCVKGNPHILSLELGDQDLLATFHHELLGFVVDQHVYAFGTELLHHVVGDFFVLANHDARCHLDLRYRRAQAREGLRQFRANRPAT